MQHPLPQRLKEARNKINISQKKLGERAGIDPSIASSRMNHYETGRHIPEFQLLSKIAAILEVPVAYFYCVDDELAEEVRKWQPKQLQ